MDVNVVERRNARVVEADEGVIVRDGARRFHVCVNDGDAEGLQGGAFQ